MQMNKKIQQMLAVMLVFVMTLAYLPSSSSAAPAASGSIDDIMSNMTLKQKITQCLMMDFRKWNDESGQAQDMTVLADDAAKIIADYQFGSIILFANNIKQTEATLELTKAMQAAAVSKGGLPLMIATDQEGGIVYRLGSGTALPGNMALGATGDPANAKTAGQIIGRELDAVSINTTLAPVVDVNNNANNSVIGLRSFSDDPDTVGQFGSAFIAGLNDYNIIGCAKHFPGHGDTATDSHYGLPIVDKSLEALKTTELKPFQTAIDSGVDMIMTAHILYPQVDDTTIMSEKTGQAEKRPATMSHIILTDILRGDMGFEGVVVTDAMNMAGVANTYTAEQSALEALKAGADMICMPVTGVYDAEALRTSLDSIISYIESAIAGGDMSEARLDEAVRRILTLKESKGILAYNPDNYTKEKALAEVGSQQNRDLERKIAAAAVTLIKNDNNLLPYKAASNARILFLCPYENERAQLLMGLNRAKAAGLVPGSVEVKLYRYSDTDYEVTEGSGLKAAIDWADLVIINSEVSNVKGMSFNMWTSLGPRAFTEYCRAQGRKSVVISANKPFDVQLYPDADAILAVYGAKGSTMDVTQALLDGDITEDENACGPNIIAGVEVLFGVFKATGKLPVTIPVFSDGTYTDQTAYTRGYGLTYAADPISIRNAKVVLSKTVFTYNGKVQRPVIKTIGGMTLKEGRDYTVVWSNKSSKNAGTYKVTITGKNGYKGVTKAAYKIKKAANPLKVKGKTAAVSYKKLQKKSQALAVSKTISFTKKGKGTITYRLSKARKGSKSYAKYFSVNKKTGKITLKKGLKKGIYKVTVKVKALGTSNYKASFSQDAVITIKVR